MSIFDYYPNSDLQDLNLDWIIRKIREIDGRAYISAEGFKSPEDYGAVGDGIHDDTAALLTCFEHSNIWMSPNKTYRFVYDGAINLLSGTIVRGNHATIKMDTTPLTHYAILSGDSVSNIVIADLHIIGDADGHTTGGEWGHCIELYNCSNVIIHNCDISRGHGDGIYIGTASNTVVGNDNISIVGCNIHENYRNNISVIHSNSVVIRDCIISHANGTNPQAGIDLEPNDDMHYIRGLSINNCRFVGNAHYAITVSRPRNAPEINISDCVIVCHESRDSNILGHALGFRGDENSGGFVNVERIKILSPYRKAVTIVNKPDSGYLLTFKDIDIIDGEWATGSRNPLNDCVFGMESDSGIVCGSVVFDNISVVLPSRNYSYLVYAPDYINVAVRNCLSTEAECDYALYIGGGNIRSCNMTRGVYSNIALDSSHVVNDIVMAGSTSNRTVTVAASLPDGLYEFLNASNGRTLTIAFSGTVLPASATVPVVLPYGASCAIRVIGGVSYILSG